MQNDIVDNLSIDMNKERSKAVVYCRQSDTLTRTIHIRLNDHGIPYDFTNVLFAEMIIVKPDGTECDNEMIRVGNELHYTYKTNDLAVPGECRCQILLTFDDGGIVTSPVFTTYVYKKEIDQKKLRSTNEYGALSEMVVQANSYAKSASNSASNAKASEEAALNSRNEAEEISANVSEYVGQAEQYAQAAGESEQNASKSAAEAEKSKQSATESRTKAQGYAESAQTNADKIINRIDDATNAAESAKSSASAANDSALQAKEYEELASATIEFIKKAAEIIAQNKEAAAVSESNAKTSETNAATYAANASNSENNAAISEANAKKSETNAAANASNASASAEEASTSAANANNSMNKAAGSATNAKTSETAAKQSETNASVSEQEALKYANQVKAISESFSGALKPLGTVTFAKLPSTEDASAGDMYNISDEFTTTAQFKEGAGKLIPAGSNVYLTEDRYWDCLAGSPVTGVKGNSETTYRRGNVNITPANIGLGNVSNNKQVKGLASGTTNGHVVIFGKDGYTVEDSGFTLGTSVPANAKFTDTTYEEASTSANGLMSATDKTNLNTLMSTLTLAVCSTARNVAAKVATLSDFVLKPGAKIAVKFTDTTTTNPSSGNLTLNVNGTGAKNIAFTRNGTFGTLTYNNAGAFYNNLTHIFTYNGTYWVCLSYNADNNTINSAGATNKAGTKLFLVGATAQNNGITSYSNANCYVGTDNKLYSGGKLVATNENLQALIERVTELEDMIGYPLEEEGTS